LLHRVHLVFLERHILTCYCCSTTLHYYPLHYGRPFRAAACLLQQYTSYTYRLFIWIYSI
jgi:hypothetical protein